MRADLSRASKAADASSSRSGWPGRLVPRAELKRLAADAKEVGQGMSAEETFCHQTGAIYARLASKAKLLLAFPLLLLRPNRGRPVCFH
jgi:hypothetical protein